MTIGTVLFGKTISPPFLPGKSTSWKEWTLWTFEASKWSEIVSGTIQTVLEASEGPWQQIFPEETVTTWFWVPTLTGRWNCQGKLTLWVSLSAWASGKHVATGQISDEKITFLPAFPMATDSLVHSLSFLCWLKVQIVYIAWHGLMLTSNSLEGGNVSDGLSLHCCLCYFSARGVQSYWHC